MRYAVTFACALVLLTSAVAYAGVYTFTPNPSDIGGLDHHYYYAWEINWTPPVGEVIVGAQLNIFNINNWAYEPNANWLYINLIDSKPAGGTRLKPGGNVWCWSDNQGGGNNWSGQGTWVATYVDNTRGSENLSYDLGALGLLEELNAYSADGKFGFGFDPDCHYENCGVSFRITTAPVPEPSGMVSLLAGVLPLTGILARKARKPVK